MVDWQTFSYIASCIALIVTIIIFISEVNKNRKERSFSIFLKLIDFFKEIQTERREKWKRIKEAVPSEEIGDKTIPLDYIVMRIKQPEPLYAIELGWIEDEIRSLNLLNELCNYALNDKQIAKIIKISLSQEISYFQNRLKMILAIRESQNHLMLFSKPHFDHLQKIQVSEYVQDINDCQ